MRKRDLNKVNVAAARTGDDLPGRKVKLDLYGGNRI